MFLHKTTRISFKFPAIITMIVLTLASLASASIVLILLGVANGQSLRNITVDDTDPAITYLPVGYWVSGTWATYYYGSEAQWSTVAGATATFTFTGISPP